MPKTPVSPKVTASTAGTSVAVLVLFALSRIPGLAELPTEVQLAVSTLVVAAVTFASGYVKGDPDRL